MTFSAVELSQMDTPFWFCLKAQPKREHIAASGLRQIPSVQTFAPQIRYRKPTRRGPVWYVEALFPGYVFARFHFPEVHRQVRAIPGVSTIVHFGDRFAALDEATIQQLAAAAGEQSIIIFDPKLKPGEEVRISAGPFRGLEGVITRLLPSKDRVNVLLTFLGREVEAEVGRNELISSTLPRSGH